MIASATVRKPSLDAWSGTEANEAGMLPRAAASTVALLVANGTPGDDSIPGTNAADTLGGEDGRDTLDGRAGNDSLSGGLGNDRLSGVGGNDTLTGDLGADTLNGGAGDDLLRGGAGNDVLVLGAGSDTVVVAPGGGRDTVRDLSPARVMNFDDVATLTETGPVLTYGGLTWSNLGVTNVVSGYLDPADPDVNGYAVLSGANIGFIGSAAGSVAEGYPGPAGLPVEASSGGIDVDLMRGFFSGAARDVTVVASAWDNGVLVGQKTFVAVKGGGEIRFDAGLDFGRFGSIDRFVFASNDGDPATRDYFGFDDLAYRTDRVVLEAGITRTGLTTNATGVQVGLSDGGSIQFVGLTAAQITDDLFA